jgi:hypothetical protein
MAKTAIEVVTTHATQSEKRPVQLAESAVQGADPIRQAEPELYEPDGERGDSACDVEHQAPAPRPEVGAELFG